ncbi:hypothetical protein KIN20_031168 [Parelaphostrongylus tenuis]|uniref:Uncharacterized protein n=1 Tax=Parelaphostrongylus tenuis TaxID=148309 RepID=A0AAD5R4S4_PARTN|nr:hypothetical protein KIN20_031168 [Parelaphostrongylus tenuis]
MVNDPPRRIVVGSTITAICSAGAQNGMCSQPAPMMATVTSVPANYTLISGTLMTSNIIMANWS